MASRYESGFSDVIDVRHLIYDEIFYEPLVLMFFGTLEKAGEEFCSNTGRVLCNSLRDINLEMRLLSKELCRDYEYYVLKRLRGDILTMFTYFTGTHEVFRWASPFTPTALEILACIPGSVSTRRLLPWSCCGTLTWLGFLVGLAYDAHTVRLGEPFQVGERDAKLLDDSLCYLSSSPVFSQFGSELEMLPYPRFRSTLARYMRNAQLFFAANNGVPLIHIQFVINSSPDKPPILAVIKDLRYYTDNKLVDILVTVKVHGPGYSPFAAPCQWETSRLSGRKRDHIQLCMSTLDELKPALRKLGGPYMRWKFPPVEESTPLFPREISRFLKRRTSYYASEPLEDSESEEPESETSYIDSEEKWFFRNIINAPRLTPEETWLDPDADEEGWIRVALSKSRRWGYEDSYNLAKFRHRADRRPLPSSNRRWSLPLHKELATLVGTSL